MLVQSLIKIWQIILDIGGPFIIPVGFFFSGVVGYLVLLYLGRAGITNTESPDSDATPQHQGDQITKIDENGDNIETSESIHTDDRGDGSTTEADMSTDIPE